MFNDFEALYRLLVSRDTITKALIIDEFPYLTNQKASLVLDILLALGFLYPEKCNKYRVDLSNTNKKDFIEKVTTHYAYVLLGRKSYARAQTILNNNLLISAKQCVISDAFKNHPILAQPLKPTPLKLHKYKPAKALRAFLLISDVHYGIHIRGQETPLNYSITSKVLIKQLDSLYNQVVNTLRPYKASFNFNIELLGDIVEGYGVYPSQAFSLDKTVSEQVIEVSDLLANFIYNLSKLPQISKINVHCVFGNHGFVNKQTPRWDNFDYLVYYILKQRLEHIANFYIFMQDIGYYTVSNKYVLLFHGDFLRNKNSVNNFQTLVETAVIQFQQNNKMFASLVFTGHFHKPSMIYTANKTAIIFNGSWLPTSPYIIRAWQYINIPIQFLVITDSSCNIKDIKILGLDYGKNIRK